MHKKYEGLLEELIRAEIEKGEIAGAVVGLVKSGRFIYQGCFGYADMEEKKPMENSTLIRLYSMTKPVTAILAMIFLERGMFDIYEPVSKYLPEYKKMKVLENGKEVPAGREILIRDLLNMTSGLVYPDDDGAGEKMGALFDRIQEEIRQGRQTAGRELVRLAADVPLAHHPGEYWRYGISCDVMGMILEEIGGKKLSELFAEELFEPLEMEDTGFYVPKEKQKNFSALYSYIENDGLRVERDRHLCLTDCLKPPLFESAGAGLVSSLEDYGKFGAMLSQGGIWKGRRFFSERMAAYLQKNQLKERHFLGRDAEKILLPGYGYANFMRVCMEEAQSGIAGAGGETGWDGWTGNHFAVNMKREEALIFMMQRCGYSNPFFIRKIRNISNMIFENK